MRYIKLNTGSKMPIIGLGTWQSQPGEVYQAIRWAIKIGYTSFDCAAIYGNEVEVGQALHDAIKENDITREELFVTSKLWNDSHAVDDVRPALEKTLKDLQLEYLDLYLIHWPVAQAKGTKMPHNTQDWISLDKIPLETTWKEMEKAYNEGLVKAIGVSNFSINRLKNIISKTDIVPAVNQVENHPFLQQQKLVDYCNKNNIAVTAYSPLGSFDKSVLDNQVIIEIANKLKATPAQVVLAWQMERGLVVIPKSVNEARLKENFAAQVVSLDNDDMAKITLVDKGERVLSGDFFLNTETGYTNIWE